LAMTTALEEPVRKRETERKCRMALNSDAWKTYGRSRSGQKMPGRM